LSKITASQSVQLTNSVLVNYSAQNEVNNFVFGLKNRNGQQSTSYTWSQSNSGSNLLFFSQIGPNQILMKPLLSQNNASYKSVSADNYQVAELIKVIDSPKAINFDCDNKNGRTNEYFKCDLIIDRITDSKLNLTIQSQDLNNVTSMTLAGND
jgi:hypothetical protein